MLGLFNVDVIFFTFTHYVGLCIQVDRKKSLHTIYKLIIPQKLKSTNNRSIRKSILTHWGITPHSQKGRPHLKGYGLLQVFLCQFS